MADFGETGEVNARIVYWGISAAGKSANLRAVHSRLRPDHRGELQAIPTPIDPTATYEVLPIELGAIAGVRTRFQVVAVPGAPEQAATRKRLLDQVDGIVLVVDARADRVDENLASCDELRASLADYGRSLDDVPIVVQFNKRDESDPYTLEALHRRLGLPGAAVFEAVASEGTGVLQTLTTLSKRVIRTLRDRESAPPAPAPEPIAQADPPPISIGEEEVSDGTDLRDTRVQAAPSTPVFDAPTRLETAILADDTSDEATRLDALAHDTQALFDPPEWDAEVEADDKPEDARLAPLAPGISIVSVGEATREGSRAVRIPIVLGDAEGRTTTLSLTIQLDAFESPAGD